MAKKIQYSTTEPQVAAKGHLSYAQLREANRSGKPFSSLLDEKNVPSEGIDHLAKPAKTPGIGAYKGFIQFNLKHFVGGYMSGTPIPTAPSHGVSESRKTETSVSTPASSTSADFG